MPYLMDAIAFWGHQTLREGAANHPILGVYPDMMRRIQASPRYLLDEKAIDAAVELTLGRPKVLYETLAHLRVPYPSMWIEWPESGRERLRQTFGNNVAPGRPVPKRLGFLIEAPEKGGRQGRATWIWDAPGDEVNIAPISPHFDLDEKDAWQPYPGRWPVSDSLAKMWQSSPVQFEALQSIWRTAAHLPNEPWGSAYMNILQQGSVDGFRIADNMSFRDRVDHCMADVYGEYIVIWAVIILLTSHRKIVDYKPVERQKLNKARRKRNEAPLFDHVEVTMHLNKPTTEQIARGPLDYRRKSPRIHYVASYLARRGDKYWVTRPYIRGSGTWVTRTVHVKG